MPAREGHGFEGWFRNNEELETQSKRGFVDCPACGSSKVSKALMAPGVSTGRKRETMALAATAEQKRLVKRTQGHDREAKANAENVGDKFAEEARKIHFGETEARGIYGAATPEQARGLVEDGVGFMPLPSFPDEQN